MASRSKNLFGNIESIARLPWNGVLFACIYNLQPYLSNDIVFRIKEGRPMTMRGDRVKAVAETVELFITLLDQINLNIRSVDDLFQTLNNLHSSLNSMSLTQNDDIKLKVQKWLEFNTLANSIRFMELLSSF